MKDVSVAVLAVASLLSLLGGTAHRKTEQGNLHLGQGELDEALADYTEAQVHAPDSSVLHYDVGNVLYRQGDFEGAAEAYERALLEGPADLAPLAAYNLGNARFNQQKFQDAVEAYRRTLEASPDDVDAKRNLELALRALEQQQQQPQPSQQDPQQQQQQQQQQGTPQEQDPSPDDTDAPAGKPPASPEEMTPEQARRLLDSLAEEERRQLEQQQEEKKTARGDTRREKDW